MQMNIRSKLLIFFIPLIVIPMAVTGYLAMYNSHSMFRESEKVSASIEQLQSSASLAEDKISSVIESKTLLDYRFFSRHIRQNIELQVSNLKKITATLAGADLVISYMRAGTEEREQVSVQLKSLFANVIRNYNLSEISMSDTAGQELLCAVTEAPLKIVPLSKTMKDKSGSEWFQARVNDEEQFIHTMICFKTSSDHLDPESVVSLTCPLEHISSENTPRHRITWGYLRLVMTVKQLTGFIITPDSDLHGQIILTDSEKIILAHTDPAMIGTMFDDFHPRLADYHIVSHKMLGGLLNLHVLIWREKISQSSLVVRSLAGAVHKGAVEARKTSLEIRRRIGNIEQQTIVITLFALLSAVAVVIFVSRKFSDPITRLSHAAIKIASGDLEVEPLVEKNASVEIVLLAKNFNKMRLNLKNQIDNLDRLVEERTGELQKANLALRESLEELHRTQNQLIQSGKMAALGNLVAGVAHEINTPVGIGVTAASLLEEKTSEIALSYSSGQLRRSDLEKYFKMATQSSTSILSNLERASELIQSFKQVAVDQSVEEKRRFRFKRYMDEVLLSLWPGYKRTGHTISVSCPDDLFVYSYPGVFMQIITNMVVNSLIHGFEDIEQGHIHISVSEQENELHFRYSDDGKGMNEEHIRKIFDPFFTTKRARGGTGLGMHIVYNLVTQTLDGQIECSSVPGKGTDFFIRIQLEEDNDVAKK